MLEQLSGATRIFPILGDPIAQVKSPGGMTRAFEARGIDAICIPMQVPVADFSACIALLRKTGNCDGIIITVPHKFSAFRACDGVSERAAFLGSVNCIRRSADGKLFGDQYDGDGFVAACKAEGCDFKGRTALLAGAGGAGTAIAHSVAQSGVARLDILDLDAARRDDLAGRLAKAGFPVRGISAPDTAYDIVLNATPMGMRAGDPLPVPASLIKPGVFVGDVVTKPEVPPLIELARQQGSGTSNGVAMFNHVRDMIVDFLLERGPAA